MADRERRQTGRARELFGEVMFGPQEGADYGIPSPEDDLSRGQKTARQSVPVVRQTDAERRREREQLEEGTPGLIEGADLATQQEWVPRLLMANPDDYAPDPDYEMTEEELKERAEGLPEDAFQYIAEAQSKAQAEALEKRYRQDYENEQKLAEMGFTGIGLRVGAALTDPAAWGIGAASSALLGPAGFVGTAVNRANRVRKIVQAGTAGAAGNLAVESAIRANKPLYDDMNLLYATGIGFGLGAGLSALSRNPSLQTEVEGLKSAGEGIKKAAEEEIGQIVRSASYQPAGNVGDAGAARVSRFIPIREDDTSIDTFLGNYKKAPDAVAPRAAFGDVRFSSMATGLSSDNPAVRAAYAPMAEEGVGYTNRNVAVQIGASERQVLRERQVTTEWLRSYNPNFREWMSSQSQKKSWKPFFKEEMATVFNRQVTDFVEGIDKNPHPAVRRQGEVMRKILDDYRKDLNQPMSYRQEFGRPVKGFGTLEEDPFYVPREFDLQAIRRLDQEFGTPNLEMFLARAIKSATDDITEEAAMKAGRAYLKTVRSIDAGMGMDTGRILGSGDAEEIKAFLRNNANGEDITEADIEDIVDALTVRRTEGGQKYSKKRTPLNMDFKMELKRNPETGSGSRTLDMRELFNRDAHDLLARYNRRMSGALAMARYRIPGLSDGITSHGEFETLKNKIRDVGHRQGIDPEKTNRELAELDKMYRAVMGMPNEADLTRWGQALKFFRDWSFMRFMGQVGFAQVPELGVAISGLGIKTAMKGAPQLRHMIRDAKTGKIKHEVVDELEMVTGHGGDWLRSGQIQRFNDMTGAQDTFMGQGWKDKLEFSVRRGKRGVFALSGMSTINTALQRGTMNGIVQRFGEAALGTGKLMNRQRLRSIGLNDAQVDAILENIRKHATFKDGLSGKRVQRLNLNKWDLKAEANFTEAMFRYSRRLVQENDIGQFRQWMAHPVARMFLQFRSFIIGAHEKQLLHNLHMRDFQSFSTFVTTTMMATAGYTAMTYARSIGREDQGEYLERRLNPEALAKATFERSSWSALMPTAIDTMVPGTFQFSRSSGQAVSSVFGNPTADTADSMHTALSTILTGDTLESQEDVRNVIRLLPFQNANGVAQMVNIALGETGLPEDAPEEDR
ncbi:hypothetical protein GCM10007160_18380 [Litchfieldella qijiaojingensis]|uniref:PLxRFG domain-containing protein n=1 Tax=Litchfieldella qijiaojingensis TaxID=980347 RepID=A0ABQ2YRU1_9GAMM|nr:hypothetical protein [Halomonas qijiaojingensis]GGX91209.1 hypothetical protein GCM10007160_18380 [Halomonas qijiaojingensis]